MALGDTLRTARQALRISLNQAALETRIRQSVLEALEESDFSSLPPRPFLRGLLRNYALYLHLDPDTILDEYDSETGHKSPIVSLPPQPSEPPTFASPQTNQPPEAGDAPEAFAFPPFQISSAAKPNGDVDAAPPPALDTVFQVAPEIESYVPPPTAPLNLSQEPPTLARRIGSTRIPEAVALIALAVALFALVSVGFTAFQNFSNPFASPGTPTTTPTATATIPANSTPTGIPTLAQTLQAPTTAATVVEPTLVISPTTVTGSIEPTQIALATATSDIPADAQMTLQIEATGEVGAWIIVDEDEVFNGTLKNDTRSFTAHTRLFVQIKNIGNGRVFFQGTRILPRNQQERTELYRAWLMSPLGTPVIIPPTPYPSPIAPAEFPTPTPLATNTLTPTPSATSTVTPTQTRTSTQTSTQTLTATARATASLTLAATTTQTLTPTPTRTATTAVTTTPTATRTLPPGVSAMSTR